MALHAPLRTPAQSPCVNQFPRAVYSLLLIQQLTGNCPVSTGPCTMPCDLSFDRITIIYIATYAHWTRDRALFHPIFHPIPGFKPKITQFQESPCLTCAPTANAVTPTCRRNPWTRASARLNAPSAWRARTGRWVARVPIAGANLCGGPGGLRASWPGRQRPQRASSTPRDAPASRHGLDDESCTDKEAAQNPLWPL